MAGYLGAPVQLEPASPPRADGKPLFRCAVSSRAPGAPATVIVKHVAQPPGQVRLGLLNECAALEFLTGLELDPPVCPAFYGADTQAGVLVLEDLGDGDSVADALLGPDAEKARTALVSLARTLGRMQAA